MASGNESPAVIGCGLALVLGLFGVGGYYEYQKYKAVIEAPDAMVELKGIRKALEDIRDELREARKTQVSEVGAPRQVQANTPGWVAGPLPVAR